jgi:(4S)-4-hydroxy-5-phosphonooxypentane-2,3-dione isomerase
LSAAEEIMMQAIWVKIRIKPTERQRFLHAIELDALESERDEPGCLRFNVLQDAQDENVYYCYEVFADEAAMEAHKTTPHFAAWRAVADALDGPYDVIRCRAVFPADRAYWANRGG